MSEVRVKATPAVGLATYIQRTLSPDQLAHLKPQLGAEELRILEGRLLANESVGMSSLNRLTDLAAREAGQPAFEFGRAAGRFGAELGTHTVYKFVLALLSPQSALRTAAAMSGRIYSGGRLEVEVDDTRGRIQLRDFPVHDGMCGRMTGWFEFMGEKASKDMRTTHATCRARGDAECAWDFEWSK
jgi:hypothetical protein